MAIITVANYKSYASITVTTWDTLLGILITAAQADVERYCNRKFDVATYTERFNGDSSGFNLLQNAPITSITSVSYLSRASDGTETATALSVGSYRFDLDSGELYLLPRGLTKTVSYDGIGTPSTSWRKGTTFVPGWQNYQVVYVGGYGGTYPMPADLQLAMYQFVDELFAPIKNGAAIDTSLASETLGDYSYTRKSISELSASMQDRFGRYRRMVL